jgi:GNAT superfamily N-acetyltransferase
MDTLATTEAPKRNILEPMNLHNTTEFDELLRQRVICGWDCSPTTLEAWRAAADIHTISMFWVVPPSLSQLPAPQRHGGHISMQSRTGPPDDKLAGADKPVLHIFNLFILPERRRGGLGRAAVQALEAWAKVEPYGSPECRAITLNAISRRYIEDDGEEWRGLYTRVCTSLGIETPAKGSSNEDWYTRMGYVKWKEQPMYPVLLDGSEIMLIAALLKKELA